MHDDPSPAPVPIGAGLSVAPAGRVSMPSAEVAPREFVTCRQRAFAFSNQINTTSPVSLPPIGQRSGAQPVSRRRVDPVMDSDDYELPDYDDKRPSQRED